VAVAAVVFCSGLLGIGNRFAKLLNRNDLWRLQRIFARYDQIDRP